MSTADAAFAERYGPWALVAGASEGVGAAFAHAVAARGLGVVLLSRRQAALDDVAAGIRADTGVDTRAVAVDLAGPDAVAKVLEATAGLEIGLLMYCAGADPNYEPFLASSVDVALAMVHRNCIVPMELCHHFGGSMVARGRGGMILVSSGAALVGARNMVAYAATKAFDMVMAEALWAELHDDGVDVLGLVLGLTDTPALRQLLVRRGNLASADDATPIPGAATAAQVAADALEHLADGPTWFVGDELRAGAQALGSMARSDAVKVMIEHGAGIMDTDLR
ncbi:MAG TPA: SDR family NAD(P)-dependent oxidoreductase [Acidimicrobiia bacterium]